MNKMTISALGLATAGSIAAAQPTTVFDFGPVFGSASFTTTIAPNEVQWFSFSLASGASYLDLTTSLGQTGIDTEIGIYDSLGNRVGNDDDDGVGLASTLSFGAGSGLMLGDAFNLGGDGIANGEDGVLPATGIYYVAIGEFNVDFAATGFGVTSTGVDTGGTITLTILTDAVPAPGAVAMLGLGGLVATRRRRA
jgi:MYXO-CTERM domain-containing protein